MRRPRNKRKRVVRAPRVSGAVSTPRGQLCGECTQLAVVRIEGRTPDGGSVLYSLPTCGSCMLHTIALLQQWIAADFGSK